VSRRGGFHPGILRIEHGILLRAARIVLVTVYNRGSERAVIYLSLSWASVPSMLRHSFGRRESWYLRGGFTTRVGGRVARLFNIWAIDLDIVSELEFGPNSLAGPMDRAIERVDALELTPCLEWFAQRFPTASDAEGILRNSILRMLADRAVDAFYADTWVRSLGYKDVVYVGASPWDKFLLDDPVHGARVTGSVSRAIARAVEIISRQMTTSIATAGATIDAKRASLEGPLADFDGRFEHCKVLLDIHRGLTYGNLYSHEFIFSEDIDSPLSRRNVVCMGRLSGPVAPGDLDLTYVRSGRRWSQLRVRLGLFLKALLSGTAPASTLVVHHLASTCARAEGQSHDLSDRFPALRLAVFIYDVQVPSEFVLALHSLGIPTVAMNERPQSVIWGIQPFAVSRLLTASEFFTQEALNSTSVAVREVTPFGMWRTDLLHQYLAGLGHPEYEQARTAGQRFVVALPFHAGPATGWHGNPLATGASSVNHFLEGMANLAEEMPELRIIIRGKNDHWIADERFTAIAARIESLPNIGVSREYSRLDESYRLCARAELIIAKHTSLVDEALAVGIPCLVHDFTENSRDFMRPVVPYLPRRIWVEDEDELRVGVEFALRDDGLAFKAWWESHRRSVYGPLNDGRVRDRARAFMNSLAGVDQ